MKTGQKTFVALGAVGLAALAWASPLQAQDVVCEGVGEFPCSFQSDAVELQKVPAIFKFQSRVSQAKLPLGEAVFNTVFVKVMRGAETLCLEQFSDVTVQSSVLNLEIGRNMSCELDEVLAENSGLQFQVCLGGQENCLRPLDLAASPYAVKASFASQSQNAYQADIAAQANYAHRVTADRDLLLRNTLGTGYFDFYTHPAESVEALYDAIEYLEYAKSGFIQWTPLASEGAMSVHIVAKDPDTDQLRSLDHFVVAANETIMRGDLTVTERGIHVTGNSDVAGNLVVAGQILMGNDPTSLLGFLDNITHGIDGELQITDATTISAGGIHVTGDSDVQGALGVNNVAPVFSLDVTGDINFTGNLRRNGEPLAIAGLQWDSNENNDLFYEDGNVGIGTRNPGFDLDVNGDINFTGVFRRNGQAVPISPWTDDGGEISYFGEVTAARFFAESGSRFTDLTIGEEGTGLSRGEGEIRDLGAREGLRFFNNNGTLAALMADDGNFITGGDILTANLTAAGDLTATGNLIAANLTASGTANMGRTTINAALEFSNQDGIGDGGRAMLHGADDTLVINPEGDFAGAVQVGSDLNVQGNAVVGGVIIDESDGLGDGGRAIVHGLGDELILNFDGDLAGGVRVDSPFALRHDDGVKTTMIAYPENGIVHPRWGVLRKGVQFRVAQANHVYFNRTGDIVTDGQIFTQAVNQASDRRIKNIIGISNGQQDLQTLKAIEITDYTLKDARKDDSSHKMVIAQQLEEVYPQAVSQRSGTVPDIFAPSEHVAFNGSLVTITLNAAHGVQVGDQISAEIPARDNNNLLLTVTEVIDSHTFVAEGWQGEEVGSIFVYGHIVDDFRAVDYTVVSMLHVSATQELARKVERLESMEQELAQLRAENERLREQFSELSELRQEMAAIKDMCSQRQQNACDAQ